MSRTETTVVIDRSVEDVWVFLTDPQNLPAWCPEADRVTQLSDGPFATGTTLMVSGRIGPLRFRSTQHVTVFEARRAIELRSVDGLIGGSLRTRVDVKPDGARTRLTATSDVQGLPGWLAILGPGKQKDREAVLATLKHLVEAREQTVTAPATERTAVEPSAARTEPTPLAPDPEPLAESQPAAPHPSVAEQPVAPVDGNDVSGTESEEPTTQAEAPATQAEAPATQAEAPTTQAEPPTTQAEAPIAEEEVQEVVSGSIATDDPSLATSSQDGTVDVAPARDPAGTPPAAADDERVGISHVPSVDEERLVLRLETERGPAPTFEITRSGATIGRAAENTVRLDDLSVSRRHARISYRQGGYWLNDLKSASGTWVDEKKLRAPRRLGSDQIIRIGILRLRVVVGAASDETPTSTDGAPSHSELAGNGRRRR